MFSVRHMSVVALAGTAAVLVAGLMALIGLLGLRLQRRGAARSWAAPGALALCLLPLALGLGVAGLVLRQVLAGMALTGAGGVAAIAAGSVETLVPLLLGLVASVVLTACAFLTTAVGSSRASDQAGSGLAGWVLLALSTGSVVVVGGLVWMFLSTVALANSPDVSDGTLRARLNLSLAGALALVAVTFACVLASAVLAPRGPSGVGMMLASLTSLAFCGMVLLAGLWGTWSRWQTLSRTAVTGLRDGELPEPHPEPILEQPAATPVPPPPPPPPDDIPDAAAPRSKPRAATPRSVKAPEGRVYRVGGAIKEPTKLKNVTPDYPELAKQARVSGVVILEATIGPRGDVTSVKVLRGADPMLDEAAADAVKQWVYSPTLLNGVPVPVIMTVTVNFKLR
jgi:protein TonB